jgi:hypothetical protein
VVVLTETKRRKQEVKHRKTVYTILAGEEIWKGQKRSISLIYKKWKGFIKKLGIYWWKDANSRKDNMGL